MSTDTPLKTNNESKLKKIENELLKTFSDVQAVTSKTQRTNDKSAYESFCLYLSKGKSVILKVSKEYLDHHSLEEFRKHLQRNIYFVTQSNINKTIYLLKNFEIEVSNEFIEIGRTT